MPLHVGVAHGRVLIAGLGLGMIVHGAMKKPEVKHVTVIEKSADVIGLVSPSLPPRPRKMAIIEADIFDWRPARGSLFDVIYFDIWPDRNGDNLTEIAKLHRSFARFLNRDNPNAWMNSWYRDQLVYERARDRRNRWW